jgi:hypothetical protein
MSEEKLQNLVDKFPQYTQVFQAVFNWFITHPKQRDVSMESFYTSKYSFSREEINIAFILMKEIDMVRTIYRVIDDRGTRIGRDFEKIEDIPPYVDTMWGEKKKIEDVFIVPFYSLTS